MPVITIVLVLLVLGVVMWLINTYIPMEPMIKRVMNIAVVICVVVWLLKVFGVWSYLSTIHT